MRFQQDEKAVSPVVAAVLLFALFTTASLMWSLNTLPEIIADRENNHQERIKESFGNLKSGIDALSASDDLGAVSESISLGAAPVSLVQPVPSSGRLSTTASALELDISGTNGQLALINGRPAGGMTPIVGGPSTLIATDITSLQGLVISASEAAASQFDIVLTAESKLPDGSVDESVTATLSFGQNLGCVNAVHLQVTGTLLGSGSIGQTIACSVTTPTAFEVNVNGQELALRGALQQLGTFDLTFSQTGDPDWDYSMVWTDDDGRLHHEGTLVDAALTVNHNSGKLAYEPSNVEYVNQDVIWEGGAVIVDQGSGGSITIDPSFQLGFEGTTGYLDWTVTTIVGDGDLSGSGRATATARHLGTLDRVFVVDDLQIDLTSEHLSAWESFLSGQQSLAGLSSNEMCLESSPTQLTMYLGTGPASCTTTPTITEWIIHLREIEVIVTVK